MLSIVLIMLYIMHIVDSFGFRMGSRMAARTLNSGSLVMSGENKKDTRVVIVGATGYIGKFVVKESIKRGYDTVAVVREGSAPRDDFFKGATVVTADVTDEASLDRNVFAGKPTDVVISCLASRSGIKSDSYLIDYQATLNTLNAARTSKAVTLNT